MKLHRGDLILITYQQSPLKHLGIFLFFYFEDVLIYTPWEDFTKSLNFRAYRLRKTRIQNIEKVKIPMLIEQKETIYQSTQILLWLSHFPLVKLLTHENRLLRLMAKNQLDLNEL